MRRPSRSQTAARSRSTSTARSRHSRALAARADLPLALKPALPRAVTGADRLGVTGAGLVAQPSSRSTRGATQQRHRIVAGELLAGHAGHEVPAADQAASLEAAQGPQDLPPRGRQSFPDVDVAEHHAPSRQQLPGDDFGELVGVVDRADRRQQRPAPLNGLAPSSAPPGRARARAGSLAAGESGARAEERSDRVEAVCGYEPSRDSIPQAFLDLNGRATGDGLP